MSCLVKCINTMKELVNRKCKLFCYSIIDYFINLLSDRSVYASFGGLLMCMSGDPIDVQIGQEIYLLLRKAS
jgi:hypothetical protein